MRDSLKPIFFSVWLALSGCSSAPEIPFTAEQVQQLTDVSQLEDMHRSLSTQLMDEDPQKFPAEFSLLNDVGQRLVELHRGRLEKELQAKRIRAQDFAGGAVPLPVLAQLKQELTGVMAVAPDLLPSASAPIQREEAITGKLIATFTSESNNPKISAERRAVVYDHLFNLSGDSVWQKGRDNQMDVIINSIHTATNNNIFNHNLEEKIDFVRSIYVDQPEKIVDDMQSVYANMYANRFFAAVKSASPAAAFKTLEELSQKPDYPKIRAKLQPSAARMADYFAVVADPNDLQQAFLYHRREIEARRILGLPAQAPANASALAQQLFAKFKHLETQQRHFAALGMLYGVEIVDPQFDIAVVAEQQEALIKGSAIRSVSLADFRSRDKENNFGEVITPLITQHLAEFIGNEIRVVRDEDKTQEVDARISGNVLEAKVESSKAPRKRRLKVTVGQEERTNPAYINWLKLPPKERAKQEKPDEMISVDKEGEISITSTLHRKVGVFAVSYRLATLGEDPVVFPDSITLQAEHEDESNEGVEAGELVIPYKVANLPPDSEIMNKLAQDVASEIAGNLAAILQNQEIGYLKMADRFAAQGECRPEVENLARAIALMRDKKQATSELRLRLVERTLACF